MKQSNYETIVKCIQHGAPAIANELIGDLNNTVELANNQVIYLREQQLKAQQEENVKKTVKAENTQKA